MSHLIDIFLQPGKAFAELKEKPTFLLPMSLLAVGSAAMTFLYFTQVDGAWFIDQMLSANPEATAKEIEQARKVMPGAQVMGYIATATALLGAPLMSLLFAVYYLLAGKVAGNRISFRHGLSLATWGAMPGLLGIVVALIGVATMEPRTAMSSLNLLNVDPLLVELPIDHAWNNFFESLSLLTPWTLFLGALGWRVWGRTGWGQAIAVSLMPTLLIYGIMASLALMR